MGGDGGAGSGISGRRDRCGGADEVGDDLAGAEDAGQARAGVGAGAGEEEVGDVFTDVVRAKPGGLGEDRLDGEGAAEVAAEGVAEVARVYHALGDDVAREVGQIAVFEVADDGVAVGPGGGGPVHVGAEVGDGREDVPGVAAEGGEGGVGGGGAVQVEGEVVG